MTCAAPMPMISASASKVTVWRFCALAIKICHIWKTWV